MTRPPLRSIRWLADANSLAAALVVKTNLGRPIHPTRPFLLPSTNDGGDVNANYNPYQVGACERSGSSLAHVIGFSSSNDITFSLQPRTVARYAAAPITMGAEMTS
jgi:hypothetical protein